MLKAVGGRVANAAFRDKPGDETARGNIEGIVGGGAGVWGQLHVAKRAILPTAGHHSDFRRIPLFDGNVSHAVFYGPVDGGRRQGDVERNAVIARGQCLQIGADLVADVAIGRGAVGADDHHVDLAALHEMADKLQGIVEVQKDMRFARQRRAAHVQASNDEARAEYMVKKVLEQQDKLNLKPNQWKRGNIVDKQAFDPRG